MQLRPLASGDLDTIRRLRNANREWFFDNREVSAAQQATWFENLGGRGAAFYVIEDQGEVVGTISLTTRDGGIEIGNLILDEAARGRGLMRRAVADLTTTPGDYFADVKIANERSANVFRAAGFSAMINGDVIRFAKRVTP
jgi:RimJ/RimL family protein N-acetyltransferase